MSLIAFELSNLICISEVKKTNDAIGLMVLLILVQAAEGLFIKTCNHVSIRDTIDELLGVVWNETAV